MMKKVLTATAVLALAGSSIVYAQQQRGPGGGPDGRDGAQRPEMRRGDMQRQRFSDEDMSALTDARVAALKAGLRLTPDQEKNWPAFETAYRDIAKLRAERRAARMDAWQKRREANGQDQNAERQRPDPMERLQRRADAMSKGATAFKQLTDAAAPLYQSLDEGQKRRFNFLARFMHRGSRFAMEDRGRFEHGGPRGFERREHGRPRFGGMEGSEEMQFAADAPARADLAGLVDDDPAE